MGRMVAVAAVLGLAVLALLWFIASGASESLEDRNQLLEEEGRNAAKQRHRDEQVALPPPDLPRGEGDEVLRLSLPEGDRRRLSGGAVVLSVRGNRKFYRRQSLEAGRFLQGVMDEEGRRRVLALAQALPGTRPNDTASGWPVSVLEKGRMTPRWATAEQAEAMVAAARGREQPTTPPALTVVLAEVPSPAPDLEAVPWPVHPALPGPSAFLAPGGGEVHATESLRSGLLEILAVDRIFRQSDSGALFRVVSFASTW